MRYIPTIGLAFILITIGSFSVSAQELPREAGVHFFCLAPAAIDDVANALEIGDEEANEVASAYASMRLCAMAREKIPVLATKRIKVFTIADGGVRAIYQAFLPTGRTIWFIGPMIGRET